MQTVIEKNNFLREVDLIEDREYILSELKKAESEKTYTFEESYKYGLEYLNNLQKEYDL